MKHASRLIQEGAINISACTIKHSRSGASFQCFEDKLSPETRFLRSLDLSCFSWVELLQPVYYEIPRGCSSSGKHRAKFVVQTVASGYTGSDSHLGEEEEEISHSSMGFNVHYTMLRSSSRFNNSPVPPMPCTVRVLSVDIEVWAEPSKKMCPRNGSTEVLQIGNVLKLGPQGIELEDSSLLFVLEDV